MATARSRRLSLLLLVTLGAASACTTGRRVPDAGADLDLGTDIGFAFPDLGFDAGPPPCMRGTIDCDGECVRVAGDDRHCGSCGNACPAGVHCAAGFCSCDDPLLSCDGVCLDPSDDVENCGECGYVCGPGEMCTGGECLVMCDAPNVICRNPPTAVDGGVPDPDAGTSDPDGGVAGADAGVRLVPVCADLQTDAQNCGSCNSRCLRGATCTAGRCACPTGFLNCGGACVDPTSDPANCGSCRISCGSDGMCEGSRCTSCGTGLIACTGRCLDASSDRYNCGSCGRACGAGEGCAGGLCSCVAPLIDCGAGCTNLDTDVVNCGTCGTDCGPGGVCAAGACTCAAGLTMCSGSCRNLDTDLNNCRTCGTVCPPLTGGICGAAGCGCPPGLVDCGGVCSDPTRDRNNCGTCGVTCGMGQACQAGLCVLADSFRVTSFGTTNCRTMQHDPPSGDDRGGIAVSPSTVFVTGDGATVRLSAADLSGLSAVTPSLVHNGLIGDLETEEVYVLLTAAGTEVSGAATITQLGLLDGTTGMLTATRIPLSMPITTVYGSGIFSGYAEALIGVATGGLQWWRIELPSGVVTRFGNTQSPPHRTCENWAFWGVAESFGDVHYAAYIESSTRISRLAIPAAGVTTTAITNPPIMISTFTNLGDMCSMTFSPSRNRWYFHHEYGSEFSATPSGEIAGYCDGTFDRP